MDCRHSSGCSEILQQLRAQYSLPLQQKARSLENLHLEGMINKMKKKRDMNNDVGCVKTQATNAANDSKSFS